MPSRKTLPHNRPHPGFSLLEILIVLGILVLLMGLGLVMNLDRYRADAFRAERARLVSTLHKARNQSINNICFGSCVNGKPHGVHLTANSVTLFQGSNHASRDTAYDQVFPFNAPYALSGLDEVVFTQLSGEATPGVITLSDSTGRTSDITILSEGQISWTN